MNIDIDIEAVPFSPLIAVPFILLMLMLMFFLIIVFIIIPFFAFVLPLALVSCILPLLFLPLLVPFGALALVAMAPLLSALVCVMWLCATPREVKWTFQDKQYFPEDIPFARDRDTSTIDINLRLQDPPALYQSSWGPESKEDNLRPGSNLWHLHDCEFFARSSDESVRAALPESPGADSSLEDKK